MNAHFRHRLLLVVICTLLLTLLPIPSHTAFAAPARQAGAPGETPQDLPPPCAGETNLSLVDAPCKNMQLIFIIDDSGSMGRNDPRRQRFQVIYDTVERLGQVYLSEREARARVLPQIEVATLHFATDIIANSGWVRIAPSSPSIWQNPNGGPGSRLAVERQLFSQAVIDLNDNSSAPDRRTNFLPPLEAAAALLEAAPVDPGGDCPKRQVFLLTDGAPDLGRGELYLRKDLSAYFADVRTQNKRITDAVAKMNILAFYTRRSNYWDRTRSYWEDGIAADVQQVVVGGTADDAAAEQLPNLVDVVRSKVALGMVGTRFSVPPYLQALQISYAAPNIEGQLEIVDPQGNRLEPNGRRVRLQGAGSLDQVWEIQVPAVGEYGVTPVDASGQPLPGGSLQLKFIYPALEDRLQLNVTSPPLQQFTHGQVQFRLEDTQGNPIQLPPSEDLSPQYWITFTPSQGKAQQLQLAPDEDGTFTLPDVLPLSSQAGAIEASVIAQDYQGSACQLYHLPQQTAYTVEPVRIVAEPQDPAVCTPSQMPVRFPLKLQNAAGQPAAIDLPLRWEVASQDSQGRPVQAYVLPTSRTGEYRFSLNARQAGKIVSHLQASVLDGDVAYPLFDETFENTQLLPDRAYVFEPAGIWDAADAESLRLNQRFGGLTASAAGHLLAVRHGFGYVGDQDLRISGRFYDRATQQSVPGIERFQAQLLPAGGGTALAVSSDWQDAGDGTFYVSFGQPPLGDYDLAIVDTGAALACTQIVASGASLSLVRDAWEYVTLFIFISLLVVLLLVVLIWLFFLRPSPPVIPEPVPGPRPGPQPPVIPPPHPHPGPPYEPENRDTDDDDDDDDDECQPDNDLTVIEGIGPKVQNLLRGAGYSTFQQLSEADAGKLQDLLCEHGWSYMNPETWPQQAHLAAECKWTELDLLKGMLKAGRTPGLNSWNCGDADGIDLLFPNPQPGVTPETDEVPDDALPPVEPQELQGESLPDDLTRIEGIGPAVEKLLYAAGITTFAQLADVDPRVVHVLLCKAGWGYLNPTTWPEQARLAAEGDWMTFENLLVRLKAGRPEGVETWHCPEERDDLKLLEGVEGAVERLLNEHGIMTYRQLAETGSRQIRTWLREKPWGAMMDPDSWPEQAGYLAAGDLAGFQALTGELRAGRYQ